MIASLAPEPAGWSTETTCGAFLPLTALGQAGVRANVLGVLRYERADPFAVRLECHLPGRTPVVWRFARETLAAGVRGRAGVGSVLVCRALEAARGECVNVYIELRSDDIHGVLRGPVEGFDAFLGRSRRLVPYGEEHLHLGLDTLITRLTARSNDRGPDGLADVR